MSSILHVDMDAFYASVEQRDDPSLRGRPVIVGADPKDGRGRGVVAACSYEARAFGVHSALPIGRAWRLCPHGAYVRPRMARYSEVSQQIMEVLRGFTDLVEPISIDEAFLDVSGSTALFGAPEEIAAAIKAEVRRKTELTASVGLAPNKFVAKIASDLRKPDGLVVVRDGEVEAFLEPLPVSRLWGVGPKREKKLRAMGAETIGDVARMPQPSLVATLGPAAGEHIWRLARGDDDRAVEPHRESKSISAETTFEQDTADRNELDRTLRWLADRVAERLRREGYRGRRVALKLRYSDFSTFTRQTTLPQTLESGEDIYRAAAALLDQFALDQPVRLIGIGAGLLTRIDDEQQLTLVHTSDKHERLEQALDVIRDRFGESSVRRGR